jgi:hypothetical protein
MAVYESTRNAILSQSNPNLKQVYQYVKSQHAGDDVLQKYLQRLVRHKLKVQAVHD